MPEKSSGWDLSGSSSLLLKKFVHQVGGEGLLNAMLSGIILDGSPGSQVKKHVPKSTSYGFTKYMSQ